MMARIAAWWHRVIIGHEQYAVRVSVPLFDPSAKGVYIRCSCRKDWSL